MNDLANKTPTPLHLGEKDSLGRAVSFQVTALAHDDGATPNRYEEVLGFSAGASCDPVHGCVHTPAPSCQGRLTRTPGYWGNHLPITALVLPVQSCGIEINNVLLKVAGSAVEDLCKNNNEAVNNQVSKTSDRQLSLIRQRHGH